MPAFGIESVAATDCTLIEAAWPFAHEQADAIERHWQARRLRTPDMFNGRVLVLHHGSVEGDTAGRPVFRGACFEVEFKAFLAWREFGFPGRGIRNCFSMAALEAADGAFLLGEMAPHNATAGQIYFPSGTPDRSDVVGDVVDVEGSAARELLEETGLGQDDVVFEPGLTLVSDRVRTCFMKRIRSPESADILKRRLDDWLAAQAKPELARMHVVRRVSDLTAAVPAFVAAYIAHRLDN